MKIFTAAALILLFIIVITAAFGILQFDSNRMIPHLEKSLGAFWGGRAKIGALSVKWDMTPSLTVRKLKVFAGDSAEPILETDRASASLELWPLFKRHLVIREFVLDKPSLLIKRTKDAGWNLPFINPSAANKEIKILKSRVDIQSIRLENARIFYTDASSEPALSFSLPKLTARVFKNEASIYTFQITLNEPPFNAAPGTLKLDSKKQFFSGHLEDPALDLIAEIAELASPNPSFQLKGKMTKLPATLPYPFKIDALWTVTDFESAGEGLHPGIFMRSLLLKGAFKAEQGKLQGINIIRQLLENLSPIPGFSDITREDFSGLLGEIYNSSATSFESLAGTVQISDGKLELEDLVLEHPLYRMQIHGSVNFLENRSDFKGAAVFLDRFSKALLERAEFLDVLEDPEGRIVVPFTYGGRLNQDNEVSPDLHYIANRLVQFRGEQLASRGIQRINDFLEAHQ